MIQVEHLNKSFTVRKREGGLKAGFKSFFSSSHEVIQALDDISFDIQEGEIVAYIGPNGAGKSSTIKILSGFLVPDQGTCTIMGRVPWKQRNEHVKDIGVVFGQRSQLFWDVPVIDSYNLLKDIYQISAKRYQQTLAQLSELLNLQPLLSQPVRTLSLGQRMRCEIAASLLHEPKILFLDEPTIGLDAVSKAAVRRFILDLNKRFKTTVILTTHDMQDVEALAQRIILIGKGKILLDGTLDELKRHFGHFKYIQLSYQGTLFLPPSIRCLSDQSQIAYLEVDLKEASISEILSKLSLGNEITDIVVKDQSIEDIVKRLYAQFSIA